MVAQMTAVANIRSIGLPDHFKYGAYRKMCERRVNNDLRTLAWTQIDFSWDGEGSWRGEGKEDVGSVLDSCVWEVY